ncbi:MAG: FAD:protein FMN transferase [Anaerovoracaceae bacterium]|jgi:thiamine biosynthesis lipoprotein
MIKKLSAYLIILILLLNATACGQTGKKRYEAEFLFLFDTLTRIVGYAESKEEFREMTQEIYDNLEEYHQLYDIYNDYKEINNLKTINDNAGIKPVQVDQRIIDLLTFSKDVYNKTNGKVNIAFGAVLKLWHDYRTEGVDNPEEAQLPPMDELIAASEHTNIEDLIINQEAGTVYIKDPDMRLDVGAIAKGYAVEQASKRAKDQGFTDFLISVGGNVRAMGTKQDSGELWQVGVQNPDEEDNKPSLLMTYFTDKSMVTSGVYERYYTVDGKKYHHIIDSETLMPTEHFIAVTIITPDSGMADALSTAIFNMTFEEGLEMIEGLPDTEAMWIKPDGEILFSSNFEEFILE